MSLSKQEIRKTFYNVKSKQDVIDAYQNLMKKIKMIQKKTEQKVSTCIFKRCTVMDDILEGINGVHKEMEEKGLLTDETTYEDMSKYAGQHVILTEREK